MRTITDHASNPINDLLTLTAIDGPGPGGASHLYQIAGPVGSMMGKVALNFQTGPIGEVGINGVTNEVLMAVVIDRLRSFQGERFACRENALALTHMQEALHWLHARTRDRVARNVEGFTKT